MIEGKTKTGFKYKVNEWALSDWETCEAICDIESGDASLQLRGTRKIAMMLLGDDGLEKLKDHVRKKNGGHIPFTAISEEITDILTSSNEVKN